MTIAQIGPPRADATEIDPTTVSKQEDWKKAPAPQVRRDPEDTSLTVDPDETQNQPSELNDDLSATPVLVEAAHCTNGKSAELLSAESAKENLDFPLEFLPEMIGKYVDEAAESISCPNDYVGVPMLAALGAAIGTSCLIEIKKDWRETASLYTMVIGRSGSAKSPAFEKSVEPLRSLEKAWGGVIVNDTTVEALAVQMSEHPKGAILLRDELSAWIKGFNQYKSAGGSDEQFFLEAWSGSPIKINRKTKPKEVTVPRPFLAIAGGIQPAVLSDLVSEDRVLSGFAARFLLAYPESQKRSYTENVISERAETAYHKTLSRLCKLSDGTTDSPRIVCFSPASKKLWVEWIGEHHEEVDALVDDSALLAAWGKIDGYMARLILIVHLVRQASESSVGESVDQESFWAAEDLINYFKAQAIRVYGKRRGWSCSSSPNCDSSPQSAQLGKVERAAAWLAKQNGQGIRPRDLQTARIARDSDEAKGICKTLVEENIAEWTEIPGKSKERLRLKSAVSTQQKESVLRGGAE